MRFESAIADRLTAAVLFALGAGMAWGGYAMDRLEIRQIHPASIPGLVPMILGAAMMLCALLLARGARDVHEAGAAEVSGGSWRDFAFTGIWGAVFALGLVSRVPFAVATAIYIAVFAGWFLLPRAQGTAGRVKTLLFVCLFAIAVSTAISTLFRYGFLVRLP